MLELSLSLQGRQVTVSLNGKESHQFSLLDLSLSEKQLEEFIASPRHHGARLFQALFKDATEARKAFDEVSQQSERTIVLILESPELDGVPWEYAYHNDAYLVEDHPFLRALPENERPANGGLSTSYERLALLFIPSNPLVNLNGEPMRSLDIEGEWGEVKQKIEVSNAPIDVWQLRPATPEKLQDIMARFRDGWIVHFSGHGGVDDKGVAHLLFEQENGASNPFPAREFIREIKDRAIVVFLSACQSAVPEQTEFGNLARRSVRDGIPFALGMQFNLPDLFAPEISGQFYNYLAHGSSIPEATRQARRAVKRQHEFFVGMIALYAAHPHQLNKLTLTGPGGPQFIQTHLPADLRDLPIPSGRFLGRQHELMRIGTKLLTGTRPLTLTLHGAGGIGKTALLRQVLMHFSPSFAQTIALGLDPLPPSLASILGGLERFLKLSSPCSNDEKEQEQMIREGMANKKTLLGLDNFETLNHTLNNEGSDEEKTAKRLYAFFRALATEGVTLCVTSREKTGLPGEQIEEIHGLEDEVGGLLFENKINTRKDALNEKGIEEVSAAVGGHPLALNLLAPIFEAQAGLTLKQFIEKIQSLLPTAIDQWTEQERHESLKNCFDFSLDNLPDNDEGSGLQRALSRLSIFSAYFAAYMAAPTIAGKWPESEQEDQAQQENSIKMIHALWERGLLEHLVLPLTNENFYLYRLHPALNPFAAARVTSEDQPAMQETYFNSEFLFRSRARSCL